MKKLNTVRKKRRRFKNPKEVEEQVQSENKVSDDDASDNASASEHDDSEAVAEKCEGVSYVRKEENEAEAHTRRVVSNLSSVMKQDETYGN